MKYINIINELINKIFIILLYNKKIFILNLIYIKQILYFQIFLEIKK